MGQTYSEGHTGIQWLIEARLVNYNTESILWNTRTDKKKSNEQDL